MDSGGLGFWRTVCASILAGVAVVAIVAASSWLFGFHHAAWLWITSAGGSIARALVFPIHVPVSVVAAFTAVFLYLLWRVSRPYWAGGDHGLSDVGERIIRLLASADGQSILLSDAARRRLGVSNLVAQQARDELAARDLIGCDFMSGDLINLTPKGREYAIKKGYVRTPIHERNAYHSVP